ncbi:hypothetical protein ACLOJK_032575 [Asimina triloba]
MAYYSPATPPRTSGSGPEYDVFLSFRGKDTRKSFAAHLYQDLVRAGIRTFRDEEELRIGEDIGQQLFEAIAVSRLCLPLLSRNYASSKWCRTELVRMVGSGVPVLPVFLDMDFSAAGRCLTKDASSCGALNEEEEETWQAAVTEVLRFPGLCLRLDAHGYLSSSILCSFHLFNFNRKIPVGSAQTVCLLTAGPCSNGHEKVSAAESQWDRYAVAQTVCLLTAGPCSNGHEKVSAAVSRRSMGPLRSVRRIPRALNKKHMERNTQFLLSDLPIPQDRPKPTYHDVFLSCSNETRKRLASHLCKALSRSRVQTLVSINTDNACLKGPRVFVVLFSTRYGFSTNRLDELTKAMDMKNLGKLSVFPVFVDVEPYEVKKQAGCFKEAFAFHEQTVGNRESVERWRKALWEAGSLKGWHLKNVSNG